MAPGGSLWYNVVASQESTDLAANQGPGCLSPLDGYSELMSNTGLGTIPCGTELWLRANGKTIQGRKVDSGGGSSFNPQIGLYPRVSLALFGTENGGEFHLQIQRVDGQPLRVVGGGSPTTGAPGSASGLFPGGTAGAGGTGTLTNDLFGAGVLTANFQVGNATNPDEDYWTAMNRIAQERYWMLFSDGETLYLADGPDLMRQKPALNLDRVADAGSINHLEFTFDNTAWNYVATHKKRNRVSRRTALAKVTSPVQGQLHAVCAIDEVRAGDTVAFSNCGPGDGRWLVGDCRRSVFEISSEINVVYALTPLTETQLAPPVTGTNAANKGAIPVSSGAPHKGSGPYGALVDSNLAFAGVDQGIDFTGGPGKVYALADGVVTRAVPSGSGWPGSPGSLLVYKLLTGSHVGRYVYTAEDFDIDPSLMRVGATVTRGQPIGVANGRGAAPGIETGWADPDGRASAHAPSSGPTSFGRDFDAYVRSGGG